MPKTIKPNELDPLTDLLNFVAKYYEMRKITAQFKETKWTDANHVALMTKRITLEIQLDDEVERITKAYLA